MAWPSWLRCHTVLPRPACESCIWREGHLCRNRAIQEMVAGHPLEHFGGISLKAGWPRCMGSAHFYRRRSA